MMAILTVEITDSLCERLDREVAAGRAKDRSALVQILLETAMDAQWKLEVEAKIDEAIGDVERGDVAVHSKGDCGKLGREYLKQKRAREATP
jgi:predicted transcriptional regulator